MMMMMRMKGHQESGAGKIPVAKGESKRSKSVASALFDDEASEEDEEDEEVLERERKQQREEENESEELKEQRRNMESAY